MENKKVLYSIIGGLVIVIGIGVVLYLRQATRIVTALRSEHQGRYYDVRALREYALSEGFFNATATGTVVNNTWKPRDIGVWGGLVKPDGFHVGSFWGRSYYGYQYFPDVAPNETRKFAISFAKPPLNRSWSPVVEFDPSRDSLPPVWAQR